MILLPVSFHIQWNLGNVKVQHHLTFILHSNWEHVVSVMSTSSCWPQRNQLFSTESCLNCCFILLLSTSAHRVFIGMCENGFLRIVMEHQLLLAVSLCGLHILNTEDTEAFYLSHSDGTHSDFCKMGWPSDKWSSALSFNPFLCGLLEPTVVSFSFYVRNQSILSFPTLVMSSVNITANMMQHCFMVGA